MFSRVWSRRTVFGTRCALTALVAIVTFGVFVRCVNHDFLILDDTAYASQNPYVRGGLSLAGVQWACTTYFTGNWHPLVWISLMLDQSVFGSAPWGFHLTNVLLHMINSAILFVTLHRLTSDTKRSLVATLLFSIHPLRLESVAWIAERKDVLSGLFWFLSIHSYVRWAKSGAAFAWFGCVFSFAAGLCAKQMLVTLPCVLVLLDIWPLGRWSACGSVPSTRDCVGVRRMSLFGLIAEKWALFLLSVLGSVVVVMAQDAGGAVADLSVVPFSERLRNALTSYVIYLYLTAWPLGLSVFYPYDFASYGVAGATLAAVALVGISWLLARSAAIVPGAFVGWLWFLGTLVPVIGLIQVGQQSLACRYMYIPGIGIAILMAWAIPPTRSPGLRRAGWCGAWCLIAAFAIGTVWQSGFWRDSETLMRRSLEVTQRNVYAHCALGEISFRRGDHADARRHLVEATRIDSHSVVAANAWFRLGYIEMLEGNHSGAEACYIRALRVSPDSSAACQGLGTLIAGRILTGAEDAGRLGDATSLLERSVLLDPFKFSSHYSLSLLYMLEGQLDKAEREVRAALLIDASHVDALKLLRDLESRRAATSE